MNLISNFGNIYLNYNNHVEIIDHGKLGGSIIKIITYKELLMELASFENKTINYFIDNGLDENTNQKGNITLIITNNKNKTKLDAYDFSYKIDKKIYFDIPYYHKHVPEGFSVFCTDEELDLVLEYVKKKNSKPKKDIKKEESIKSEPEPSKKNFICQLCHDRYDNYKSHIISDIHLENIEKHKKFFNNLSSTFKRIVNNNYNISKESSNIKSFSNKFTNDIYDLCEFSPSESIKKQLSFEKDNNLNFFKNNSNNNTIKRNKNDFDSQQQFLYSTASSNFKHMMNSLDEASDIKILLSDKKNKKRNRDEKDDLFDDKLSIKNKRIKI